MREIDRLEAIGQGPFRYIWQGEVHVGPDPATLHYGTLLGALRLRMMPETPRMPGFKATTLFERWSAHYDLPTFQHAQRLVYVIDRYRPALEYDLQTQVGLDLTTLWSQRRWRYLLAMIDRLPRHTHYSEAVGNDEEHARLLAEAMQNRPQDTPSGPALHTWTPEVAALHDILDAVRGLTYTLVVVNGGKNAKPPKPSDRPVTALERMMKSVRHEVRLEKHKALAARLLPHKAQSAS